jgi:hypothetical protein
MKDKVSGDNIDGYMDRGLISSQYHLPYNPKLTGRAKELRQHMTHAEKILWYK